MTEKGSLTADVALLKIGYFEFMVDTYNSIDLIDDLLYDFLNVHHKKDYYLNQIAELQAMIDHLLRVSYQIDRPLLRAIESMSRTLEIKEDSYVIIDEMRDKMKVLVLRNKL